MPAHATDTTAGAPRPSKASADTIEPIERLSQALDAAPHDVGLHASILDAMRAANDEVGYAAHQLAPRRSRC